MSPLAGHKASLERDLAAAKKRVSKSSRPIAIGIEEKSKYISREKTRLQQLVEGIEKAKSVLEARTVSLQREESRLAELRAELVSVLANVDVDASELKELEQQQIEQLRLLAAKRCPTQMAPKQKALQDLQASIEANVAGEEGNSLHLCVVSWNVAAIPLDDLDVWLQQVSDHFPWDLICLQEGFKRLNGIEIRSGHGVFTPCRQLGGLRSLAIIVRSGSACDDVVFLASDTRWLAVKSESMKMIFVSLHLPHSRISLVGLHEHFHCFCERLSWGTVVPTGLCLVRTQTLISGVAAMVV